MSELVSDILIFLLLLAGIGFGGISLMGLLIFPDIRSRMYTALRASLLCIAAVLGAAVIYAITWLAGHGGENYSTFLIHVIFLGGVMAIAVMIINRQVLEETTDMVYRGNPALQNPDKKE
jgi:hypothetical protein